MRQLVHQRAARPDRQFRVGSGMDPDLLRLEVVEREHPADLQVVRLFEEIHVTRHQPECAHLRDEVFGVLRVILADGARVGRHLLLPRVVVEELDLDGVVEREVAFLFDERNEVGDARVPLARIRGRIVAGDEPIGRAGGGGEQRDDQERGPELLLWRPRRRRCPRRRARAPRRGRLRGCGGLLPRLLPRLVPRLSALRLIAPRRHRFIVPAQH